MDNNLIIGGIPSCHHIPSHVFVLIHGSSPRNSLTKDDCETNRLRREGEEEEDNEAQNATLRWFFFVEVCQYDDQLTISYIFWKMWMQGKQDILG